MIITFNPIRMDAVLDLEKSNGDRLRINGELFNFNSLNEGDVIPAGKIPSNNITGPVTRKGGEVRVTVLLPHGADPEEHMAFPKDIVVTDDGPIAIPFETWSETISSVETDEGVHETIVTHRWGKDTEVTTNFVPRPEPEPASEEAELVDPGFAPELPETEEPDDVVAQ